MVLGNDRDEAPEESQDGIALRVDLGVAAEEDAKSGQNEKGAEDVDDPMEPLEDDRSGRDEGGSHDECAENSPEEDPVLVRLRYREGREEENEDKDVVDRERFLDEVAGQEFEPLRAAELEEDPGVKGERERDPHRAPRERLTRRHLG